MSIQNGTYSIRTFANRALCLLPTAVNLTSVAICNNSEPHIVTQVDPHKQLYTIQEANNGFFLGQSDGIDNAINGAVLGGGKDPIHWVIKLSEFKTGFTISVPDKNLSMSAPGPFLHTGTGPATLNTSLDLGPQNWAFHQGALDTRNLDLS